MDSELEEIRKKKLKELEESMMSEGGDWPDAPVEITDASYEEFIGKYPVAVIDCWAPWCGPCRMLGPIIDELAGEYKGRVAFGKMNTDENRTVPQQHGIMSIPTMLFFADGILVETEVGVKPKEQLKQMLDSLLS